MKTESKLDKFLSEISYLHHPDVLYKGLTTGDSIEAWIRRLCRKAVEVAGEESPEACVEANRDMREEISRLRLAYDSACKLVADMHAAAMGKVTSPVRGVVEDIEDLRSAVVNISSIAYDDMIELLDESYRESTRGHWHQGRTTHETVSDGAGLANYRIAEFTHAADADFTDKCHEFVPLLVAFIKGLKQNRDRYLGSTNE